MYVTSGDGNINYHLRWWCWPLCQSLNARQSPSLHAIGLRPSREGRWCLIVRHCPKSRTCSNKKKGSFMKSLKIGGLVTKMEKGLKPWLDARLIHCCPKSVGSHQVMVTMIYYSPEVAVITALRKLLSMPVSFSFHVIPSIWEILHS